MQLSTMIGREEDLARLAAALASVRLVTLTGPGGIGKTTLARAFLAAHPGPGGSWFVDLSHAADPGSVGPAVAEAIGLVTAGERDPDVAVADYIGDRQALLVLDNVEQVEGIEAWISARLDGAPELRIIATSRLPLRIQGGIVQPVTGLALPVDVSPQAVERSPAGALYLARARDAGPVGELTEPEAAEVAALLDRLDGLPLAIELAAGRSRLLSPGALLRRLDDPAILARRATGRPDDRHASLETVLQWSLDALDGPERALLRACALLPGSFDVDLALALAPGLTTLDALDRLIGAGLVVPDHAVVRRFRLLETVRAQVLRVEDRRFDDEIRSDHARHMATLAELAERASWGGTGQAEAAARFRTDRPHYEAAFDWWLEHDPDTGLAVFARLHRLWWLASDSDRPIQHLRALTQLASPGHEARPAALATLLLLVDRHAGGPAALELAEAVEQAAAQVTDPRVRRASYTALAQASSDAGRWHDAGVWLEKVAETTDTPAERRFFQLNGGAWRAIARGDVREALAHVREASASLAAIGDTYNRSTTLLQIAALELGRGHAIAAHDAAEELSALEGMSTFAWDVVAMARAAVGAIDPAWVALSDGWAQAERGVRWDRLRMLDAAAVVLGASSRDEEAATAAQIADRERQQSGWARWPALSETMRRTEIAVRKRLGEVRYALAQRTADGVSPSAFMREVVRSPGRPSRSQRGVERRRLGDLTEREVEVLALLGSGRSNAEIARELFISPKTASVHVTNVKAKLGATSRLEVALYARTLGLPVRGDGPTLDDTRPGKRAGI